MNRITALLGLAAISSAPAYGEIHNIDTQVYVPAWTTLDQFIGNFDPETGVSGYGITQGDTVNMNIDFVDTSFSPADLKLTATAGDSALGFMLKRPGGQFSLWTIENVSVTLKDFSTDGAGDGALSAASMSFSGSALGPYFQQAAFGVADGEFIQFSGFQVSFDVVSLAFPNDEFLYTRPVLSNWTVGTVATGPIPVTIDIKPSKAGNVIHPQHDGCLAPRGIAAYPDDVIPVAVLGAMTSVGDPVDFDTDSIDSATLAFGPGAGAINPASTPLYNQNVDSDGIDDAIFQFLTSDSGISCGEISATLTGETTGGQAFQGTDTIVTDCDAVCHN